ncbi:APC family permease [Sulfuriflexus sp.]|uniref:APC family permease n=1 Tax=Sulfuriflexus sp. TaxID=2015443 RepID=UPI0028CDE562|nr:amino acid permease [Sulfuriflexus sp.]MDT8404173.1 amino acid permease [Sulfuriflexus sp.]
MSDQVELRRSLSLPLLTLYGLGTIIGAGIYVLVGEVAGVAGNYMPLAFLVAALLVTFTAFAYAELSARYPRSAGAALYVHAAFAHRHVSLLMAFLIICIGVVSSATLARGVVGYLQLFIDVPVWLVISSIVLVLGGIAAWGIRESVGAASVLTLLEIAGLVIILWVAREHFVELPARLDSLLPAFSLSAWQAVLLGSFVAFYAFVGFEDMVNIAEEVRQPRKNLPRAIFISIVVTTLIYLAVAIAASLTVPVAELAASKAPLAAVYTRVTGKEAFFIGLVGVVAVVNGVLVQIIMASRMLYGSARQGWLPAPLGRVNARTRTPLLATAVVTGVIWVMAIWLPLLTLAQVTSFITLFIFTIINLALVVIKRREPVVAGVRVYPIIIPIGGIVFTLALLLFQLYHWLVV